VHFIVLTHLDHGEESPELCQYQFKVKSRKLIQFEDTISVNYEGNCVVKKILCLAYSTAAGGVLV